jgi:hypothetical protein
MVHIALCNNESGQSVWVFSFLLGFLEIDASKTITYIPHTHTHTHIHTYKNLSLQFFLVQTKWHVNPIFSFTSLLTQSKIVGNLVQYSLGWVFDTWAFLKLFWCKTKNWIYSFCVCWSPFLLPAASCVEYANAEDVLEKVSWCWCLMLSLMIKTEEKDVGLLFLYIICSSVPVETVETLCDCGGLWCADWWWMKT